MKRSGWRAKPEPNAAGSRRVGRRRGRSDDVKQKDHAPNRESAGVRRVTLVRGRHRWMLECAAGEEAQLLRLVNEWAEDETCPLDRFDAAVISHQLCNRSARGLNKVPDKAD